MPTAAPWADVACRASPDGRPHRPQSKSGHRSRRSGKPTGSVCRSSPLPSCVLQLAPLSPAQAATTTRGRPQLKPQDWIRSQTPGSPPVPRSQTSAAATLRAVEQYRSSMVGSPGHQLADPDHQQWSPHNAQTCAAGSERGIDAATAPNGGSWSQLGSPSVTAPGAPASFACRGSAWPPRSGQAECASGSCFTGRHQRHRRRRCRWRAGRGCRGHGHNASSCADRRARRLPARPAAGPRRRALR